MRAAAHAAGWAIWLFCDLRQPSCSGPHHDVGPMKAAYRSLRRYYGYKVSQWVRFKLWRASDKITAQRPLRDLLPSGVPHSWAGRQLVFWFTHVAKMIWIHEWTFSDSKKVLLYHCVIPGEGCDFEVQRREYCAHLGCSKSMSANLCKLIPYKLVMFGTRSLKGGVEWRRMQIERDILVA